MTDPNKAVKAATEIAQNQFVFGILFILLLALVLWGVKISMDRMAKENQDMEEKNDAVIEKIERLHEERQRQIHEMMIENKQESKEREAQLMTHNNTLLVQLQSQTSSLEEITRTQGFMQTTQEKMQESLSNLQDSFEKIESRIDRIERKHEK